MLGIEPNDWLIVFCNVIFFMVVQTYFFRLVASKQYETVLEKKLGLIQALIDENPIAREQVNKYTQEYIEKHKDTIQEQKKKRERVNEVLEKKHTWNYIMYAILALLLAWTFSNQKWTKVHTLGLVFVVFAYTTELMFFYGIVQRYEFVGDHKLINRLVLSE